MRIRRGASLDELELVYRARFAAFVRVATAVTGEEALGADAVHDAFVQAVRHRGSFRGEGPLEAWVWRLVVNAAKKRVSKAESLEFESASHSENGVGDPVRAAIAALPERQRLTLFLRYYADLDYEARLDHTGDGARGHAPRHADEIRPAGGPVLMTATG